MEKIVESALNLVREKLGDEPTGHDYWHAWRVWNLAKRIAGEENCKNELRVQLAAILHDLNDDKVRAIPQENLRRQPAENGLPKAEADAIMGIIEKISFRKQKQGEKISREVGIVRDADRLDAMGAIGIARCFATGAVIGRVIHSPDGNDSISHFHEKLLKLKDMMHTETGRKIAEKRHRYMVEFLDRFFREWEGKM